MKTTQIFTIAALMMGVATVGFAQSNSGTSASGGGVMGSSTPSASSRASGGGATGSSTPTARSTVTTGARVNGSASGSTTLQDDMNNRQDNGIGTTNSVNTRTGAVITSPSERTVDLDETDNDDVDNEVETDLNAKSNIGVGIGGSTGVDVDVDADVNSGIDEDIKDRAHGAVHIN